MSHLIWTAALFGIALLLLAIALLQYRWNMQIRRATEIRVGADLESAMMKWHLDLYGELSTICIGLQVGPDSGANDRWDDYLRRYVEWRRVATSSSFVENIYSNPDVVSDIYIWETSNGTGPRLLRLDADKVRIERSALPAELRPLLAHLEGKASNLHVALRAPGKLMLLALMSTPARNLNLRWPTSCEARQLRAGNSTRAFRP
jgi:hypothetical protein